MTQTSITDTEYEAKDYDHLLDTPGFSEDLMRTHLGLYNGYVTHTNKNLDLLQNGGLDAYTAGEVRRRLVWEFNGMRLHELYFDGMVPGGTELSSDAPLRNVLTEQFGGFDAWQQDFQSVGGMRGIGWAALSLDHATGRLVNTWINEHDAGALAGTTPILLMDVFEHAFIRDFGTDKKAYMNAYFDNVDWSTVNERFTQATA